MKTKIWCVKDLNRGDHFHFKGDNTPYVFSAYNTVAKKYCVLNWFTGYYTYVDGNIEIIVDFIY